jgi:tRNA(Glu) U13 pseudouridine synthase TruD
VKWKKGLHCIVWVEKTTKMRADAVKYVHERLKYLRKDLGFAQTVASIGGQGSARR